MLETGALEAAEREALEDLVRSAAFFELPERRTSGLPDVIQYRIRVEAARGVHEVACDDECASEALRALIDRLLEAPEA